MKEFQFKGKPKQIASGKQDVSSPSNIALVKYWGKTEGQTPANASISYTLTNCKTNTTLSYEFKKNKSTDFSIEVFIKGIETPSFIPKIHTFFERIFKYCPYLKDYKFRIDTENTFPHSSGIASSASGMSALAKALILLEKDLGSNLSETESLAKLSFLARLGSGSASRSVYPKLVVWGEHNQIDGSNDLTAVPYPFKIHSDILNFKDCILLVDKGEKVVSSTVGHQLMHNHPYAKERFKQAQNHLSKLIPILESGDLNAFGELIELEALTLHSMMMTSNPYFILMKSNTLEIIQKIWSFRKETDIHAYFTLDAGANVHYLYPKKNAIEVEKFIEKELKSYCKNGDYILDEVQL